MSKEKKHLKDYKPLQYKIPHIELNFDVTKDWISVLAVSELEVFSTGDIYLHRGKIEITEVILDGNRPAEENLEQTSELLILKGVSEGKHLLKIQNGFNPEENKSLSGIYASSGNIVSQCESEGFRNITPFIDRPDHLSQFTVKIRADEKNYPLLLSNGNLVSREVQNGKISVVWQDPFLKPSYLFAFVAGNLDCMEDEFITCSGKKVALQIYAETKSLNSCRWAMESLKRAMKWDEEVFGLEYDLDLFMIVAVDDFNYGAMENKGLNLFNSKYLIGDSQTATDKTLITIEAIIAHEYFHNWTGNRVTLRDWFQLSLKEGLTVFREHLFSKDTRLGFLGTIENAAYLRSGQFSEDAGPTSHPVRPESYIEIDNFYTPTVYYKGAALMDMQARILGREKFIEAIKAYLKKHDGRACTIEDFIDVLQDHTNANQNHFFLWYSQSGTPRISWQTKHDPKTGQLTLTLKQSNLPTQDQEKKSALYIPLEIAILDQNGAFYAIGESGENHKLLILEKETKEFVFEKIQPNFILSINRGFTAPVRIDTARPVSDLCRIMSKETDGFMIWDASQTLIKSIVLDSEKGVFIPPEKAEIPSEYLHSLQEVLREKEKDLDLKSSCFLFPKFSELMTLSREYDPILAENALYSLQKKLAFALKSEFAEIYQKLLNEGTPGFSRKEIAVRTLKNQILSFLILTEEKEFCRQAKIAYETAATYTEKFGALSALTQKKSEETDACLADFEKRFSGNFTVITEWFSIQARSKDYGSLEQLRILMKHPQFNNRNPNCLLAIFRGLTSENLSHFHRSDGSGYEFLKNQILETDSYNPSLAASLCLMFSCYSKLPTDLKSIVHDCLSEIIAEKSLSAGSYENVSGILKSGN